MDQAGLQAGNTHKEETTCVFRWAIFTHVHSSLTCLIDANRQWSLLYYCAYFAVAVVVFL